jgi:hypothetical protein
MITMSINGGDYFPCTESVTASRNHIYVCGKKDILGFFGLGNSVRFNYDFTQVIDNRGTAYDLGWQAQTNYSIADCKDLGNGKIKIVYTQDFAASLADKEFREHLVVEKVVRGYSPSLRISQ